MVTCVGRQGKYDGRAERAAVHSARVRQALTAAMKGRLPLAVHSTLLGNIHQGSDLGGNGGGGRFTPRAAHFPFSAWGSPGWR